MRHRHFALLLLALAAPAAHAAPGVEVCDLSTPGLEPTAAAIVRTACQEHRLWMRPFIESDGHLASLGVTEAERAPLFDGVTPAWRRVAQYWRESGTLSAMGSAAGATSCLYPVAGRAVDSDCRAFIVDNPWSAAFVSWVMVRSPLPGFEGSPRHMDYIARAWRHPESSPYFYADPFTGKPAPGDLLCFLRAEDHGLGAAGLRTALSGRGRLPGRSHCDIVVAANVGGDRTLYLVGGNVLNTVMMRKLPLDASGRLLPEALRAAAEGALETEEAATSAPAPPPAKATAATTAAVADAGEGPGEDDPAGPAACRPGNPSACSFNRRDWAVLLKLKPQAQLRGGMLLAPAGTAELPVMPLGMREISPAPPGAQAAPGSSAQPAAAPAKADKPTRAEKRAKRSRSPAAEPDPPAAPKPADD